MVETCCCESQVLYEDFSTGVVTDITTMWTESGCQSSVVSNASALTRSQCTLPSSQSLSLFSSTASSSSSGSDGRLCSGWVKAVDYTVRHSASSHGTLDAVSASVTLTDLPINGECQSIRALISYSQANFYYSQGHGAVRISRVLGSFREQQFAAIAVQRKCGRKVSDSRSP